ncbi:protein-disulfide reductase DsbD [Tardiphaga sp. vice304]|uniref:protein-disulfide reductase DsbD n=1 Tax=Tardiphaga sp. vice304 TaxID=2592817 RepID=UPI001162858B|nr:protein-disulfide reductase DsbD [Tardiphaga sp. vice304]QDM26283.1 protein-disulfide reductase DsbD [Tardiphaga sp. vice304]
MMRYWLLRAALAFAFALISAGDGQAQQPPGVDTVFHMTAARSTAGELVLEWKIAPGTYLYRDKITVSKRDGTPVGTGTPPGEMKDDPSFGQTEVYHRQVKAFVPLAGLGSTQQLEVSYQGCAEQGICYPPATKIVDVTSLSITDSRPSSSGSASPPTWKPDAPVPATYNSPPTPSAEQGGLRGGIGSMVLAFIGFGLLLAFTPCVFPMIPILSGMLAQSGDRLTAKRGFALSSAYVLAMALAYAVLGVVVAWSGQNLQAALQTPLALGLMSALFVALALSMFGLYDLQLPQSWQNRLMGSGRRRSGSLSGAAIMGFGSALIVGPCVTPPLAAALVYVAQTGDLLRGALALFALGLGMGLPLLAFGTFGAGVLPRSGPWLARVKYVFGFVFIGMAIWMLSRVIPLWITVLLVGVAASAGGLLLVGSQLSRGTPRGARTMAFASLGLVVIGSGVYAMIASVNGSSEHLVSLAGFPTASSNRAMSFEDVTTNDALDIAVERAAQQGKLVMLDFSAEWCVECKLMDRTVFSDPDVIKHLKDFAVIRADATEYNDETRSLMKRFSVVGPPTIIFLSPHQGKEVPDTRFVGPVDAKAFTSRLKQLSPI